MKALTGEARSGSWGIKALLALCAAASLVLGAPRDSRAQADIPYYANTEIAPNILFLLDIGSTMGYGFVTEKDYGNPAQTRLYTRMQTAKKVLTGRWDQQDKFDSLDGVTDQFGSLVNFVLAVYNSPGGAGGILSFPNGGQAGQFMFADNNGLETTLLAKSPSGTDGATQAVKEAGCWIMGQKNMNTALTEVMNNGEPSGTGKEVVPMIAGTNFWSSSFGFNNLCSNATSSPSVAPCDGTLPAGKCDPSFACRQTFIIFASDAGEDTGWGCNGGTCPAVPPPHKPFFREPRFGPWGGGWGEVEPWHWVWSQYWSPAWPKYYERRPIIASAIRRSNYMGRTFTGGEEYKRRIPVYDVLLSQCEAKSDQGYYAETVQVDVAALASKTNYQVTIGMSNIAAGKPYPPSYSTYGAIADSCGSSWGTCNSSSCTSWHYPWAWPLLAPRTYTWTSGGGSAPSVIAVKDGLIAAINGDANSPVTAYRNKAPVWGGKSITAATDDPFIYLVAKQKTATALTSPGVVDYTACGWGGPWPIAPTSFKNNFRVSTDSSVSVATVTASANYGVKINGYDCTYTSGAAPTATSILTGLAAVINDNSTTNCQAAWGVTPVYATVATDVPAGTPRLVFNSALPSFTVTVNTANLALSSSRMKGHWNNTCNTSHDFTDTDEFYDWSTGWAYGTYYNANPYLWEANEWGRYGGTDATPDIDGCSPNFDGMEAYMGNNRDQLARAIRRAINCALEGSHTRAAPAFTATSTNFTENFEIDAFFEISAGSHWWKGHVAATSFETINAKNGDITYPDDVDWDAGEMLNTRTKDRNLWVGTGVPYYTPSAGAGAPDGGKIYPDPQSFPPTPAAAEYPPFVKGGAAETAIMTYLGVDSPTAKTLIDFIRDEDQITGVPVYFSDGSPKTWALGAIVNSSPLIVRPPFFDFRVGQGQTYGDFIRTHSGDPDVLYVGAQDALIHAFSLKDAPAKNLTAGEEIWGFMPHEAMLHLNSLRVGTNIVVDGNPMATVIRYDDGSFHTILVIGLRGGGYSYTALDITEPLTPKLLWHQTHPSMGRTYSTPNFGEYAVNWKLPDGTESAMSRWLMAVGAGLGGNQTDEDSVLINPADCPRLEDKDGDGVLECLDANGNPVARSQVGVGNWVIFYDIQTGALVQNVKIADDTDPSSARVNSVPGDLLALDRDINGSIDNVMLSDLEGRVWKIVTTSPDVAKWRTNVKGDPLVTNGSPCVAFDPVSIGYPRRPTFYAPAATFDCNGFVNIIWGTGDLTDPNNVLSQDYLYAINDRAANGCTSQTSDKVDMSARNFQCDNVADTKLQDLINATFPFRLEPGEKVLSTPLIVNGRFYLTTFIPSGSTAVTAASETACSGGGSRIISGPAICCGVVLDKDYDSSDGALEVSEIQGASPPLILGPSGEVMSVASLGGGSLKTTFSELAHNRRMLHWVDVFSMDGLPPPQP